MNIRKPFQFSILQYIHDSFTEEFLNVGLAFYSPTSPYFVVRILTKYRRITNTFPDASGEYIKAHLISLQSKFDAVGEHINNTQLSLQPRSESISDVLSSILPIDDSSIRFGTVHGGMTDDLDETFEDLYHRFVEAYLPSEKDDTRDESIIWKLYNRPLKNYNISARLQRAVIQTPKDELDFNHAWKNGNWNALQPLSFDLVHATSIKKKSHEWFTTNYIVSQTKEVGKIYYLLGKPLRESSALLKAYQAAKDLLGTGEFSKKIEIIEEQDAEEFAAKIAPKIIRDTNHEE